MELQKIGVKVFAAAPNDIPLADFIDIFHSWIQVTDGIYYDVADYSHMQAGPGVVLVAHHANLSIDETDSRRGLLYNQKAHVNGTNRDKIRAAIGAALESCRRLEQEPALGGRLKFQDSEAVISINDRLRAPNDQETFAALKPDLEDAVRDLIGDASFTIEYYQDRKRRFSVTVRASKPFHVERRSADPELDAWRRL
jgi:hypothetical protein